MPRKLSEAEALVKSMRQEMATVKEIAAKVGTSEWRVSEILKKLYRAKVLGEKAYHRGKVFRDRSYRRCTFSGTSQNGGMLTVHADDRDAARDMFLAMGGDESVRAAWTDYES